MKAIARKAEVYTAETKKSGAVAGMPKYMRLTLIEKPVQEVELTAKEMLCCLQATD